jgi:hypothetical protein
VLSLLLAVQQGKFNSGAAVAAPSCDLTVGKTLRFGNSFVLPVAGWW